MDPLSFFRFHNRHISFFYKNKKIQGVIVDSIPYNKKDFSTQYVFISTNNMREWKNAEETRNKEKMESLEEKIDLLKVSSPTLISQ